MSYVLSDTAIEATDLLARSSSTTAVGWIGYIIIGGIAGWLASKVMGTDAQQGIVLNIVVGVIGALLGGWILSFFLDVAGGGIIFTFITALLGSIILLAILKAVTGKK